MRILFLALFLSLLVAPLALAEEKSEPWSGADVLGTNAISEVTGGTYVPWFSPIWEPPSGEIETFMFASQAAIGAIIIGYFFGYYKGKKEAEEAGSK